MIGISFCNAFNIGNYHTRDRCRGCSVQSINMGTEAQVKPPPVLVSEVSNISIVIEYVVKQHHSVFYEQNKFTPTIVLLDWNTTRRNAMEIYSHSLP